MDDPFWQRVVIATVGPVASTVIGTLIIGGIVSRISSTFQRRQQEHKLREELVVEMSKTSSSLYYETQRYWRDNENLKEDLSDRISTLRESLDKIYQSAQVSGRALEERLRVLFMTDNPRQLWHSTMDILTVRYFQIIGHNTEKTRRANAGPEHSRLTIEELDRGPIVLNAYRDRIREAIQAVTDEPLRSPHKGFVARLFSVVCAKLKTYA